jgi:hypothetical protein
MKATYKQFPGLTFLKSEKEFKKLIDACEIRYLDGGCPEEEKIRFKEEDLHIVRNNVFYVSNSYIKAVNASEKALVPLMGAVSLDNKVIMAPTVISKHISDTCGVFIRKGIDHTVIFSYVYYKIINGRFLIVSWTDIPEENLMYLNGICIQTTLPGKRWLGIDGFAIEKDGEHNTTMVINSDLDTLIASLLFKKYAEIEINFVDVINTSNKPKNMCKSLALQNTPVDFQITKLSTDWYTEIIRTEGFAVSGHWRLQPYANEEKKLIFINPYMKHGYHRRAKLQIEREQEKK